MVHKQYTYKKCSTIIAKFKSLSKKNDFHYLNNVYNSLTSNPKYFKKFVKETNKVNTQPNIIRFVINGLMIKIV